ncbi:MAG: hypothetical protein BWZ00_00672 [Bacteroidetes bacterium ADurb.BinA174]|nr:MAG: hypothetical protein BWZ00_00672 [Bacteroidetes bacterium ADurb.BinA174]
MAASTTRITHPVENWGSLMYPRSGSTPIAARTTVHSQSLVNVSTAFSL